LYFEEKDLHTPHIGVGASVKIVDVIEGRKTKEEEKSGRKRKGGG
jgi:hypothetical protein